MFCSRCGSKNADGAHFCKNCGIALDGYSENIIPTTYAQNMRMQTQPVLNMVKEMASSPLFLIAVIAFTAQILFSIIGAFLSGPNTIAAISEIAKVVDLPYKAYAILDRLHLVGGAPITIAVVLGQIPSILIAVGLWQTYLSAVTRTSMNTSGLTMIKVIIVINLVLSVIGLTTIEILLLLLTIAAAEAGIAAAIMVALVMAFAAVFSFNIVYLTKVIKTINTVKNTIATGVPSDRVSSFVAIWGYICASFLIFSLHGTFATLSSLCSMTALICFGTVLLKYKDKMRMPAKQVDNTPASQMVAE